MYWCPDFCREGSPNMSGLSLRRVLKGRKDKLLAAGLSLFLGGRLRCEVSLEAGGRRIFRWSCCRYC